MVWSCTRYLLLVQSVCASCKGDADGCKTPTSQGNNNEVFSMVQHFAAKVDMNNKSQPVEVKGDEKSADFVEVQTPTRALPYERGVFGRLLTLLVDVTDDTPCASVRDSGKFDSRHPFHSSRLSKFCTPSKLDSSLTLMSLAPMRVMSSGSHVEGGNASVFALCLVALCILMFLVYRTFTTRPTDVAPAEEDYSMRQAAPLASCWIIVGASLVFLNKYIFMSTEKGGFGFPYPASLCAVQMGVNTILTRTLSIFDLYWCGCYGSGSGSPSAKPLLFPSVASGSLTWSAYARTVVPTGLTMVFSLVLSNAAYLYLSVSYIQMLKASGPVSVYLTSCAVGIDVMRLQVLMVLGAIAFGVAATSMGERLFNMFGFLLQMGAFLCDALKLVLMKLMVSSQACKLDPLSALYYYAPVCGLGLTMVAATLEPLDDVLPQARKIFLVLLIDGLIAFALQVASVFLLRIASATTYSLCSVVRDVGLVITAASVFSTPLAEVQMVGYANAVCGILLFNALKEDQNCINRALGYRTPVETKAMS